MLGLYNDGQDSLRVFDKKSEVSVEEGMHPAHMLHHDSLIQCITHVYCTDKEVLNSDGIWMVQFFAPWYVVQ